MRRLPIASLAGLLLPVLFPAPLRASDTTYSETRAIPRQERASASGGTSETGNAGRDYASESESGEYADFSGDRISACINFDRIGSLEEAGGAVLMLPIALGACLAMEKLFQSHVNLVSGSADMQTLPDRPWRFGFGFGFGALYAPAAVGGMPFTLHAEALWTLSDARQLRLRAGALGTLSSPLSDYERTVFVDGAPAGLQRDRLTEYSLGGYPLTAEGLWSGDRGLYLAAGAGAVLLRESVGFRRFEDSGRKAGNFSESRQTIRPLLSLGLGRYLSRNNGRFKRFEIRYQAALLLPDRRSSFPGDNSAVAHSLTWDWGWMW